MRRVLESTASFLFVLCIGASCPLSVAAVPPGSAVVKRNLLDEVKGFRQVLHGKQLNQENCAIQLEAMYRELRHVTPSDFDFRKVKGEAGAVIAELFQARLDLRDRLKEMNQEGEVAATCRDNE